MMPLERRRLSRTLTALADASVAEALALVQHGERRARRIGITGPPGAGKSSLIARLAPHRLRDDGDLAVIAIDPTSPISGGAILGDRIRMEALATDPRIYIRSLGSRTSVDGLADNLHDIVAALDGFGFAEVLIETVGVGQVEYAIRLLVDTLVLVLTPGAGDQVQAMKSGILETADICVINKADLPGARQLSAELRSVLKDRDVPILLASMGDAESMKRLAGEIDRKLSATPRSATPGGRQRHHVESLVSRRVREILRTLPPRPRSVEGLYREVIELMGGK